MTCPDCGYIMGDLDKACLRCTAKKKSEQNPYVAFQSSQPPPSPKPEKVAPPVIVQPLVEKDLSEDMGPPMPSVPAPPAVVSRAPHVFWKAILAVIIGLVIYHASVVSGMQRQIDDQQKQINELRDIVNYNANAANMGRF